VDGIGDDKGKGGKEPYYRSSRNVVWPDVGGGEGCVRNAVQTI